MSWEEVALGRRHREVCCVLSADLISPCSLDNQAPHGRAAATAVPPRLRRVVDETHHITVDIGVFIMAGCLDEVLEKRWNRKS